MENNGKNDSRSEGELSRSPHGDEISKQEPNAETMRQQIDKGCKSQQLRKRTGRDVYLRNKYENPEYLNRTMPKSAIWHWNRKPYDGKYK